MTRRDLEQRLEALAADRRSGATDLARQALDLAQDWLREGWDPAELTARLQIMHPAIAAVSGVARLVETAAPESLTRVRESLDAAPAALIPKLRDRLGEGFRAVTLSNSSLVAACLPSLAPTRVYVLESRPGGEGAAAAECLADALGSERVSLEPDAAMGKLVAEIVDCALVGVDSFDARGALVHKVGTLPLALCCRQFGKPLYALGHTLKLVDGRLTQQPDDPFFDLTPADLVTEILDER